MSKAEQLQTTLLAFKSIADTDEDNESKQLKPLKEKKHNLAKRLLKNWVDHYDREYSAKIHSY